SVTSAVLAPGDGAIDPRLLADALEADAVARGATVVRDAPVEGLLRESDGVVGVETTGGAIESEVVVAAAGAETGRLEWLEPGSCRPFARSRVRWSSFGCRMARRSARGRS
ncbi:MAG: FAD-dependent oxidoreductase, partial [Solirubrobacterales bacterium]